MWAYTHLSPNAVLNWTGDIMITLVGLMVVIAMWRIGSMVDRLRRDVCNDLIQLRGIINRNNIRNVAHRDKLP